MLRVKCFSINYEVTKEDEVLRNVAKNACRLQFNCRSGIEESIVSQGKGDLIERQKSELIGDLSSVAEDARERRWMGIDDELDRKAIRIAAGEGWKNRDLGEIRELVVRRK